MAADPMTDFQEPEILAELDRSYGDKRERLVLEKGEFRGRSTYSLRVLWQAESGWRWSQSKPDSKGRYWSSFSIKAKELRTLGLALLQEADELEGEQAADAQRPALSRNERSAPSRDTDDIPF